MRRGLKTFEGKFRLLKNKKTNLIRDPTKNEPINLKTGKIPRSDSCHRKIEAVLWLFLLNLSVKLALPHAARQSIFYRKISNVAPT